MSRDLTLYLDDILEAITLIRSFTNGMTFQEFKQDIRTQHACIRDLEVIGEAVGHVPDSDRQSVPEVEWRKIQGLRNVLIHEYFGVDIEILWDVITNKLDSLEHGTRKLRDRPANGGTVG
jgi:uncharacterized protein with HEPN domain